MDQISPYPIFRSPPPPPPGYLLPSQNNLPLAEEINFKEYWRIAGKHRWLIGSLTASAAIIVLAWFLAHTPQYTASSTIMIQPQTPQVLDELKDLLSEQSTGGDYDYYKTQFDILKSDTLIAHVIRDYGLEASGLFPANKEPAGFFAAAMASLQHYLGSLAQALAQPPPPGQSPAGPKASRPT